MKYRKNEEKKSTSLAMNSVYSVIYRLSNILFPLISSMYVARILFADGVGKFAYAQNIAQYFVIIAALGIPNYGIREVAKNRDDWSKMNKVFAELVTINAISTTICVITYYSLIWNSMFFSKDRILYAIAGITVVLNYINVDWFFQGIEKYEYIAKRNLLVKAISFVALVSFVKDKDDVYIYAIIASAAIAGNSLLNIFNLKGRVRPDFRNIHIYHHIKPIIILLGSTISIELYTLLDTTMLGMICDERVVGYYTNSAKLARTVNSTISSIALVLLPRFSYYYSTGNRLKLSTAANKVLRILMVLSIPAAVGIYTLSEDIIPFLFGVDFYPAITTLRILSIIATAVALNNFFGTQILMSFSQETKLLISVICGAVINLCLNYFLIPRFAHNGAAIASAISEIIVLLVTFMFAKDYVKFVIGLKFLLSLLGSILLMIIAVYWTKSINLPMILELLLGVGIGTSVFFVSGFLFKNEGILEICGVLKKCLIGRDANND